MKFLVGVTAAVALALAAAPAVATAVNQASTTVNDGSFEARGDYGYVNYPVSGTVIPNWTISRGNVDWVGSYWQAADGHRSIDLNGLRPGTISTQLSTTSGASYLVRFALSGNPDGWPAVKTGTVDASGGAPQAFTYDTSAEFNTRGAMRWKTESYVFTADSTSTTLTFASTTGKTGHYSPYGPALDNVTITRILATGADCKDGGWDAFPALGPDNTFITFKNQGQCVSYFAKQGAVPIGR